MNYLENVYRIINKYNQKMKKAKQYGTEDWLYPAEVHMIEIIGSHGEITTTRISSLLGITKGAVSQTTNKLAEKEMIIKKASKERTNEVLISLSKKGQTVFWYHQKLHEEMIKKVEDLLQEIPEENREVLQKILQSLEQSIDEL